MDETNQVPPSAPVVEPATPTPPPHRKVNKWIALAIFVLVMGAAASGALYLKQRTPPPTTPTPSPAPTPSPNPSVIPTVLPFDQTPSGPVVDATVEWHYPVEAYLDIGAAPEVLSDSKFYEIGVFKTGPYKGNKLYLAELMIPCYYCMGDTTRDIIRIAENKSGKPYAIIKRNSDPLDNFSFYSDSTLPPLDRAKVIVDTNLNLIDLTQPNIITGNNGQQLKSAESNFFTGSYTTFNATNLKHVFTDPKLGSVYTTPADPTKVDPFYRNFGFYLQAPDWNAWIYYLQPNFIEENNSVAVITWNGGVKNTISYTYQERTGCGTSNYADVVTGISIQNDLVEAGVTSKGDKVYELKNKNHPLLKNIYDNKYNPYNETKVSYADFLKSHPAFFWVDPFGRMIKFENASYQPQAECGKPVIYLYPETTENVSVKISPTGGFSYTEPDYASGWNVIAKPSGELTNLADNKIYPYLFWEGRSSDIYQTPDKGFVVAKADVHNFLNEKLAKLGLNGQETADFEEYWEPLMNSAPYYFVTFLGNQAMDQIAPLEINPKPDTIIRVLMDFEPLEKPISVQGFEIRTPERKGFTVIEWGGVRH